jgi:hypothetical protein
MVDKTLAIYERLLLPSAAKGSSGSDGA